MDKATFDALCELKYHSRPDQSQALLQIQKALDAKPTVVTVSTKTYDDRVVQTLDVLGEVTYRIAQVGAKQMDDAIRARLIELGWLPPEEAEKLRAQVFWEVLEAFRNVPAHRGVCDGGYCTLGPYGRTARSDC